MMIVSPESFYNNRMHVINVSDEERLHSFSTDLETVISDLTGLDKI